MKRQCSVCKYTLAPVILIQVGLQLLDTNHISIGVGAGPVLAGPLFRRFNEIHYKKLHSRLVQPMGRTTSKVLPTPLISLSEVRQNQQYPLSVVATLPLC